MAQQPAWIACLRVSQSVSQSPVSPGICIPICTVKEIDADTLHAANEDEARSASSLTMTVTSRRGILASGAPCVTGQQPGLWSPSIDTSLLLLALGAAGRKPAGVPCVNAAFPSPIYLANNIHGADIVAPGEPQVAPDLQSAKIDGYCSERCALRGLLREPEFFWFHGLPGWQRPSFGKNGLNYRVCS
ncbi:hypothetical protein G6F59_014328 [Rhizopus arrhizus]|nr:hypothetical protein G6F59_014328 [Rhizopus arrhizus]